MKRTLSSSNLIVAASGLWATEAFISWTMSAIDTEPNIDGPPEVLAEDSTPDSLTGLKKTYVGFERAERSPMACPAYSACQSIHETIGY
jgi:hypothetical protein